ncbi:MAG: tRNA pseudouridine(55) synthase TruB [Actinomycetota bacterium]
MTASTGFVLVDKPRGPTSHDVVARLRRVFGVKRIGHAGTLDPLATGLLVVAVGPATRLLRYVQGLPKTYDVTGVLGVRTSTLDAEGEVLSRSNVHVTPDGIRFAAARFVGEIEQVPPAVSAIKVDGERAYKRAARGEEVVIEARKVTIHAFDILRTSRDAFDARVICSSGTYIRSLVADVGDVLGCGAHVGHLRRVAIGELEARDAVPLEAVVPECLVPITDVLSHLPRVDIDAETTLAARQGKRLTLDAPAGEVLLVGPDGAVGVFTSTDGSVRAETVVGQAND